MLAALFYLVALVMFVLGAFGLDPDSFNIIWMGLAFVAAGLLISNVPFSSFRRD